MYLVRRKSFQAGARVCPVKVFALVCNKALIHIIAVDVIARGLRCLGDCLIMCSAFVNLAFVSYGGGAQPHAQAVWLRRNRSCPKRHCTRQISAAANYFRVQLSAFVAQEDISLINIAGQHYGRQQVSQNLRHGWAEFARLPVAAYRQN